MRAGDNVCHPELGAGKVVSVENRGPDTRALIDFGYMQDWVSAREFGLDPRPEPALDVHDVQTAADRGCAPPSMPQSVIEARQGILALRLGQPLEAHVRRLSAGTERIEADMARIVSRAIGGDAGAVLVKGEWGSGKTHLLTLLRAIASDEGMASSALTLDGGGVRLSDPMTLMSRLLGSLRKPGEAAPRGLREWLPSLRAGSANWRPTAPGETTLASAFRTIPERALADADALQVLEDYFTLDLSAGQAQDKLRQLGYRCHGRLPSMKAHRVSERTNGFCELLRAWAACTKHAGAKGLLVIVDELDVEYASTAGQAAAIAGRRRHRADLLSTLARLVASGDSPPLVVAFGGAPGDAETAAGETLARPVVSRESLPLAVAFGGAPGDAETAAGDDAVRDVQRRFRDSDLRTFPAVEPDLRQIRDVLRRVFDLYRQAYPERIATVDRAWLENRLHSLAERHDARRMTDIEGPVPRTVVREAVELLDIAPDIAAQDAGA